MLSPLPSFSNRSGIITQVIPRNIMENDKKQQIHIEPRLRIVSGEGSSRFAGSRVYLDDIDISEMVKDLKISVTGEARRWTAELTFVAHVDVDISAIVELKALVQGREE
jgi:hypothetical protein